ncbi:unnamed protein product [Phaedon cochleariae]|uniref:Uncharacterized protein n=1 Tax=Phaedon cochleariae TaxID=80249 RepID=A0A9P0DIJ5_PHACE|nr:unnamed protein product [Phaedon cochleariae]
MESLQGNKKQKAEDLEVTGVSRSGRVRKKSSKLMDFESPDEIERSFNKRHPAKKSESLETSPKKLKHDEIFPKEEPYENFDMDESGSEYNSDYEPAANTTESSIGSVESESDYDNNEGGFKRLDANTKKKLVIKDGKIVKPDKLKGKDKGASKSGSKKTPSKTSPVSLSSYQLTLGNYENSTISPPSPRGKDAPFRVSGIKRIDVAAHLKLLGESLTIIGERLKEHECSSKGEKQPTSYSRCPAAHPRAVPPAALQPAVCPAARPRAACPAACPACTCPACCRAPPVAPLLAHRSADGQSY